MARFEKVSMFGFEIYSGSRIVLMEKIHRDMGTGMRNVIFAINPLKVIMSEENEEVKKIIRSADILIPDGIGILYAAKKEHLHIKERITGIDLMNELCRMSVEIKASVFIYGAEQGNLEQAVINLKNLYPGIDIAGHITGYEKNEEYVNKLINDSGADILFVAMGSPIQEIYIDENKDKLPSVKVFLGVGGSVDVMSGNVKRAPLWVRRANLEWLYRICFQPRRLPNIKKILEFIFKISQEKKEKK